MDCTDGSLHTLFRLDQEELEENSDFELQGTDH
jgi:hypothetical protein